MMQQAATELEKVDGEFDGPATKIDRDWSEAPVVRLSDVQIRQFMPAWSEITGALCEILIT